MPRVIARYAGQRLFIGEHIEVYDDQTHENYREPLAAQRVAGVDD